MQILIQAYSLPAWIMVIVSIMAAVKTKMCLRDKKQVRQGWILTDKANNNQIAITLLVDHK